MPSTASRSYSSTQGDLVAGAELVGAAQRLRHDAGAAPRPWEIDATARCIADLRVGLSTEHFDAALATGHSLALPEIVSRIDALTAH